MAPELRKTGISLIGEVSWGTHFCHFYETKQDLLDTLVPYFKAGLESKEFCLWVISDSEFITLEEARGALAQAVPDLDRHLADGNIEILKGLDWYLDKSVFTLERVTSAWDAKLKRALARGYDGMRVSGDTFWLAEKDWKDFFAYEKQLNESITNHPMTVLCTYPLTKSGAAEVLDVVQAHQFAIARRQGEWEIIETPELIHAKAEIERLNDELEQKVIERTNELKAANDELREEIAERSQAEDELRRQKEILQQIFNHIPVMISFADADGHVKLVNREWERTLGWSLEEIRQQNLDIFAECYPDPEYRQQVLNFVAEAKGEWVDFKTRVRDGRVIDTAFVRILLSDGTRIGIGQDISERKRAEALLHAKEQEFRAIVENAPDQIIRYDREFRRTYVNPAVAKAYGLPAEALIGKPIGSVIQDAGLNVEAEDLAQIRQRIASVFDTGKSCEFEITWPLPTGRKYYSSRFFPERDLNGSVINVLGIARDITERRSAEEELQKEKEILEKIFDNIPVMIGFVGDDGRVKLVNPEWERVIGWTLKELEEQDVDIFAEAYPDASYRQEILDLVAASTGEWADLKIKVRDGRVIDADCAVVRLSDGTRVAIARDITESKQAEEKLKQSERQLAEAQRLAHIGSWDWDLRTNAVTWSDELYHIFGLEPGTISVAEEVDRFIHPDDLDLGWDTVKRAVASKEPYDYYHRILRPDGTERIARSRGSIMSDERGEPISVFGATQDVTELKRAEETLRISEENFRRAFYTNPAPGVIVSVRTRQWLNVNGAFVRTFGYTAEEGVGKTGISLGIWSDTHEQEEVWQRFQQDKNAINGYETRFIAKSGAVINVLLYVQAIELSGEECFLASVIDITERKRGEEQLRRYNAQLRALSASVQSAREEESKRIAREIHDELGSALTSLKWDLEGMEKMLSEPKSGSELASIKGKARTMTRLVDGTIDVVRRISAELRPGVLDDLGLMPAIEWQARQFHDRTGIVVHCDCSLDDVGLNQEQSTTVFRILQEALTNILRHAQASRVDIRAVEAAGEFVLTISDNGKGISEDETSGLQSLGLLGMRERAILIGGKIDIAGVPGKGTVITLIVPLVRAGRTFGAGK